jgi:Fe-S-cluster-containing dehydrogenase component
MSKVFLVDIAKCNGCYGCQIVCKDEHCGNDWRPYAAPQPDTGQFWMRIDEKTRGQVPVVRVSYTPMFCAHCDDAPCEAACAAGAFERRDDGLLLINPDTCNGCGSCVDACPQAAIYFDDKTGLAQKCTGCAHLLDNGWEVLRCVDACSHDAILYKEESEVADLLLEAEHIEAVSAFGPRVYYLNLPKRFVAGSAIDFAANEVVIGAKVSLFEGDSLVGEQKTDWYGDFKFDQVAPAEYRVVITMEGYSDKEVTADVREIDLFVGEIGLDKA